MSKLDLLIDPEHKTKKDPDAKTSPAWRIEKALKFSGEFAKARVLPKYRVLGIRNPNTEVEISESEKGDLVDREDEFKEVNGLNTLSSGEIFGHRNIAKALNNTIIPIHINDSVRELEADLCRNLQEAKKDLADLGADPLEPCFAEKAMMAFDKSVALQFLPMTDKIGDGVAMNSSSLLTIVESVADDTDFFAFGFQAREAREFIDKLLAAMLAFAIQTAESGVREVEEPDNMRLRRFWRRALVKFKSEVEYLLKVASEPFALECAAEIEFSQRLSRLSPRMEARDISENLKMSLANFAATILMKSIYDQINDGCVRERRGAVEFAEDDASIRKERKMRIKNLEDKLAHLRRLPSPKSKPKKNKNATDSSHNNKRDGHEDKDGDGPSSSSDRPGTGDGSGGSNQDAKPPSDAKDASDGDDDDAGDGKGGGGNISSIDGGGSAAMCSQNALARSPTSPAMVSEQSTSEMDGSDTDVEDFDSPKKPLKLRARSGRGRGNATPQKSSVSTKTPSSNKRKPKADGRSSKQIGQRTKGARVTFEVGMKIESHFDEPKKGWSAMKQKTGREWSAMKQEPGTEWSAMKQERRGEINTRI